MKSNYKRAKLAIILIWVSLALDVISSFSSYMQITLLESIANGEEYQISVLESNDNRELLIGVFMIILALVSAIAFLLWFSRAYGNLHTKVENLAFSVSGAVWSWFIPIVNFFRPYTIMKEMYERTDAYIKENQRDAKNLDLSQTNISIWWTFWIISALAGQVVFRLGRYANEINELITVSWLNIMLSLISIPLSIYTVRVIQKYSEAEAVLLRINSSK